jgi:hypothetical protein
MCVDHSEVKFLKTVLRTKDRSFLVPNVHISCGRGALLNNSVLFVVWKDKVGMICRNNA